MKSYRSSVHICDICDAAQKCRVSSPGSLIRDAQEWDVCILHLGVVTRPKRSTCTDGIRHYCHVLAQYILPMAKVFLATRKESVPPSKLASLYIASIGWMQSFTYIHTLCKGQMLQAQTIALHLLGAAGLQDSLAKITTRERVTLLAGWLAAWRMAGWLRPRKAREAQRGPERRTVDRTSLSCAWLEVPHKQIYDQGGSPQICLWNPRGSPRGLPLRRVPNRNPLQTQGLPTSRITTREAPHKQNYIHTTREPYP